MTKEELQHECKITFETRKIDDCSGIGYDKCSGINPMTLEIWYQDKDGTESYYDNWRELIVRFCPFCGLESK